MSTILGHRDPELAAILEYDTRPQNPFCCGELFTLPSMPVTIWWAFEDLHGHVRFPPDGGQATQLTKLFDLCGRTREIQDTNGPRSVTGLEKSYVGCNLDVDRTTILDVIEQVLVSSSSSHQRTPTQLSSLRVSAVLHRIQVGFLLKARIRD